MHVLEARLHRAELRARDDRRDGDRVLPTLPATREDLDLLLGIRVADRQPHQEAVELRLGQRVRALEVDGILRRDHQERRLEHEALALDGDLGLLHGLEQRALRLRRGAIDLVGEEQVGEDRTAAVLERAPPLVEQEAARDVARQEIGRELDALEVQVERLRDQPRDERLRETRVVLDQDVAVGEDAGQELLQHGRLPDDDPAQRARDVLAAVGDGVELHGRPSISDTRRDSSPTRRPAAAQPPAPRGGDKLGPPSSTSRGHRITSK